MKLPWYFSAFSLMLAGTLYASEETVHCLIGHELKAALAGITPGSTLHVSGACFGPLKITNDNLLLVGDESGSKAILQNPSYSTTQQSLISIENATGVWLTGFQVNNGRNKVTATNNSSFTFHNMDIEEQFSNTLLTNANAQLSDISIIQKQSH